jgi:hypothetical protein
VGGGGDGDGGGGCVVGGLGGGGSLSHCSGREHVHVQTKGNPIVGVRSAKRDTVTAA